MQENNLFQLIKKLTPAEKRYFKLFASRQGSRKNYLKVFDAIDEMDSYDEERLQKKFKKEAFAKQLHVTRNYLTELIMKSLRSYYEDISPDSVILNLVREVEITYIKGLYRQCRKQLYRAEQLAVKYERYNLLTEILRWQRKVMQADMQDDFAEQLRMNMKQLRVALEKQLNQQEYNELFTESSVFIKRFHIEVRSEEDIRLFDQLMQHPLLKDESCALCFESRLRYWQLHNQFAVVKGDLEKAYQCTLKQVQLFESTPTQIEIQFDIYLQSLNNLANRCLQLKKYDEMEALCDKLYRLPETWPGQVSEDIKAKTFVRAAIHSMGLHFEQGTYKKALHLLEYIQEGIKEHDPRIGEEHRMVICYNLAYLLFANGRYSEALKWVNKIINEGKPEIRQDLHSFSRILNIIVHAELQNFDTLPYIIRSTYRYLTQRKKLYRFESVVLDHLRKLPPPFDHKGLAEFYRNVYNELLPFIDDPYERKAFNYLDFIAWLNSKMHKITFEEAVQKTKRQQAQEADTR